MSSDSELFVQPRYHRNNQADLGLLGTSDPCRAGKFCRNHFWALTRSGAHSWNAQASPIAILS